MPLLIDVFGYLSIILHGFTIIGQSVAVGGAIFLVTLARPLSPKLQELGPQIAQNTIRIATYAAIGLIAAELFALALQLTVLQGTLQLPLLELLGAQSSVASVIKLLASVGLAVLLLCVAAPPASALLGLCAVELVAATMTSHAAARLDHRPLLLGLEAMHQLGAAIWIGGLPCFLGALNSISDGARWRIVGARFSRMSMAGVGSIVLSGVLMSYFYVGAWVAFYGTAYGIMVGAKVAMLGMLLILGGGNFLLVERLRTDPATDINRLKRFAEVEIGIGFSVFFAAASLTSVPPAIDQITSRVEWHEVVERNTPHWPRLRSPDHDVLALPALQTLLDQQATRQSTSPEAAFIPGAGLLPPRNAADIAWSEYNHHWAGLFVLAVGIMALLHQSGRRWARHWPLIFLGLAVFLFLRSDPEVWPLGAEGFFSSLRDVEVLQHRFFVLLTIVFAIFEWRVRTGRAGSKAALVFPVLVAAGGAMLLTHSHAISNVHDQILIELTHTPLALLGIIAGWARWLELRLQPRENCYPAWVWPICLILASGLLILYREA